MGSRVPERLVTLRAVYDVLTADSVWFYQFMPVGHVPACISRMSYLVANRMLGRELLLDVAQRLNY